MPGLIETYEQALEYLFGRINYERLHSQEYTAGDFKLDRMRRLLELLGNPHERLPAVHITGTKGKGSTAVMLAGVLSATGLRVGLFTSPHITHFEERMTVAGVRPSPEQVVALVNQLIEPVATLDQAPGANPTYFEITTAMAWLYFVQQGADCVVLEVGLGGRLDATNVCNPAVCIITTIARDHTHLLGSELSQIAREKGGIIKAGVPLVSGVLQPEPRDTIADICTERGASRIQLERDFTYTDAGGPTAPWSRIDVRLSRRSLNDIPVPLLGAHQAHNAALAVAAADELVQAGWSISDEALRAGMSQVRWPARVEVVAEHPTVVVDAAHNWTSIAALIDTLRKSFRPRAKVLIFAATRDKDVLGMLRQLLPEFDTVILTCYLNNPRTVPVEQLLQMVRSISTTPVHAADDPATALKLARRFAGPDDLICTTGSFFIAAEIRELIIERNEVRSDALRV
ncbi:MAG TPA: folylpolyglutamate synthase/dihydrofolate synthase family protein [Planctomycetaceae bacterium]|nr:folylpolyglutamate synthase/dihydrofolate synthase family protein [Planctomycetaceae bacterium]